MIERFQVYKCLKCENIVEATHGGKGDLVCCGEPMRDMKANTVDAAQEKHVPVIEKTADGYTVKVGSVAHPMLPEHYIEWVELIAGDVQYRKYLNPGKEPQASFKLDAPKVVAREYCTLHGLWKAEN